MSPSTPSTAPETGAAAPVHVAVAVIVNPRGEVLLSRRPDHVHQGGLWEFPGGKCEPGERVADALRREIHEELGLGVRAQTPLIRIPYRYPDKSVLLDVWRVEDFEGEPHGREGQPVEWVAVADLRGRRFPAANRPIIRALELPQTYLVTPAPGRDAERFLAGLECSLAAGVRLVQLRAPGIDERVLLELAEAAVALCHRHGAQLLLNASPRLARRAGADGVHLKAAWLPELKKRPLPASQLVAVSCHTSEELRAAQALGADFAVLSPVRPTASHPDARPLGWERFAALVDQAGLPVYALGGMAAGDIDRAIACGAQGIAAIRGLWKRGVL